MSAIDTKQRVLKTSEKAYLKREIAIAENDAKGEFPEADRRVKQHISLTNEDVDTQSIYRAYIARKALANGSVEGLTPHEKNLLSRRMGKLKEYLVKTMVPRSLYYAQPTSGKGIINHDFRKAVNAIIKQELSPEYNNAALEYQNICRMLDPDDSTAGNLEIIRPD